MNTYTLTEVELQELLRGQRELCYNAWLNMPQWDDDTPSDLRKRGLEHILGAPPPPLPSGAKKEDIPAEEALAFLEYAKDSDLYYDFKNSKK